MGFIRTFFVVVRDTVFWLVIFVVGLEIGRRIKKRWRN